MIKIDLITGFLGAGKTTFIHAYARWLMAQGQKIGILENDYGAVNVDRMLLQDLEGPQCDLDMIAGGCDADCHRRRFRTKLIAMGMLGYDRVLVEPSGIYDVDEFFDALCEAPLDRWYEPGSVIAILDAGLEEELSPAAAYLLASEAASAGCVVLSRAGEAGEEKVAAALARLDRALQAVGCARRFGTGEDGLTDAGGFESLCFLGMDCAPQELRRRVQALWGNAACGRVFRVKGFLQTPGGWLELNAARDSFALRPIREGQAVLIVIGEGLDRQAIADALGAELPV